jgi:hypothetical protein
MRKFTIATVVAFVLAAVVTGAGAAAAPVSNEHFKLTSAPYADGWCGVAGTSIDTVVAHLIVGADGAVLENLNLTTVFTATASGKSMEVHIARVGRASAAVDNGDGTETIFLTNNGLQNFKLPNGPLIVRNAGSITFAITLDTATGDFVSFEVVEEHGQFPPGCAFIIEALT